MKIISTTVTIVTYIIHEHFIVNVELVLSREIYFTSGTERLSDQDQIKSIVFAFRIFKSRTIEKK